MSEEKSHAANCSVHGMGVCDCSGPVSTPKLPSTPMRDWMVKNGLEGMQPTMELRWRWKVLQQKWIRSEMQYSHKWVPIRVAKRGEK